MAKRRELVGHRFITSTRQDHCSGALLLSYDEWEMGVE